jgi:threonine aldolase
MRQAGVLAACGLYALDNNIARLADDHERARQLAEGIGSIEGLSVKCFTNMVFIEPQDRDLEPLRVHLQERRILIGQQNPPFRLVTHLDIDDAGIDRVVTAIHSYYR